jgi:tetratricopeptide (TPR) repeat protein
MRHHQPFRHNAPNPAARPLAKAMEHHRAGRLTEAEKLYRAAIRLAPRNGDALRSLGALYMQAGKPEQALPLLQDALQAQPNNPEILNNLGVALQKAGRGAEAATRFRQALAISPDYVEALKNLGHQLQAEDSFADAAACFEKAWRLRTDDPNILFYLGTNLYKLGNSQAALDCFSQVLQMRPNDPGSYINMGACWRPLGNLQEAVVCYEAAISLRPESVDALSNLGEVLWEMGRGTDARTKLERALQIMPNHTGAIANLSMVLHGEGRMVEALEHHNRVLSYMPEHRETLWDKSFALLSLGEYREGWKLYETGLGHLDLRGSNPFAKAKMWDGAPASDKHLLVWAEQGFGDALQFVRYALLCKERVGTVSVLCRRPLVRLFKALPFVDHVFDVAPVGYRFDEQVPMMSLPHLFGTVFETVPAAVPYLRVDPEIQEKWAARFAGVTDAKIGLVWAGGSHRNEVNDKAIHAKLYAKATLMDQKRSVGLERLKPWLDLKGARFYNLQKDEPVEQIATLGLKDRIVDFMSEVADFADTAAIIQNLDLVITVDTSVAHLAGGLGKPVWILSRYNADWRWLQNRPTNPWYPTARIFGQPTLGDWDSVIADVGRELANEIAKKTPT